jgi:hypothetical protein
MFAEILRACHEGDRLRGEGEFTEALQHYQKALSLLDAIAFTEQAQAIHALYTRASYGATRILIAINADIEAIEERINLERHALEQQIPPPIPNEFLQHDMTAFLKAVDDAESETVTVLLESFFGVDGPRAVQTAKAALIRNYLIHAQLLAKHDFILDAQALAGHAVFEILNYSTTGLVRLDFRETLSLIRESLNVMVAIQGETPNQPARMRIIRTLLPMPTSPLSVKLLDQTQIALILASTVDDPE